MNNSVSHFVNQDIVLDGKLVRITEASCFRDSGEIVLAVKLFLLNRVLSSAFVRIGYEMRGIIFMALSTRRLNFVRFY